MSEPVRFPIEAGHVMTFARAVADPNPIYHDAAYAATTELGHAIAPPTFTEALRQVLPEFHMRPPIDGAWIGSGREPSGLPAAAGGDTTVLHAEQHFEYHRPIRVGEVLTASTRDGETWEKQSRTGGRMVFREQITEFRDEGGAPVVISRQVAAEIERAREP